MNVKNTAKEIFLHLKKEREKTYWEMMLKHAETEVEVCKTHLKKLKEVRRDKQR